MNESFENILKVGGNSNSLGRTDEIITAVLNDELKIEELYLCLFSGNAWIRMRAADALEKVCRQRPDLVSPYIDRFIADLHSSTQASIQWHLAQIYAQVKLKESQRNQIIAWMKSLLKTTEIDWIASANIMDTLTMFSLENYVSSTEIMPLFQEQQKHPSKSVVKRATKYIDLLKDAS